ncbi:MAG: hypothetical protein J6K82_03975 [Alphaproteobacteria bacterium]|nr:hypothetical protein [Alphaproteobacteria bacterium]
MIRFVRIFVAFFIMWPLAVFAQSCPTGFVAYEYDGYVPAVAGVCPSGYVAHDTETVCGAGDGACWIVEQIRALCGAGITKIKTSNGVSVALYSDKATKPSMNVQYNGAVCYADMVPGRATNAINVKIGDVIYHLE